MLLTSAGLTAVSLLIVQHTVANHVRGGLSSDLADSVESFRNLQREREADLARLAELMADLPSLKALMTSRHAPTIQDGSRRDVLSLRRRPVCACWIPPTSSLASIPSLPASRANRRSGCWTVAALWTNRSNGGLPADIFYEVVLAPIYFGPRSDNALLGVVAVGYEMNAAVARQVGQVAASQVAILSGNTVVVSTLNPEQSGELKSQLRQPLPRSMARRIGNWGRKVLWFRP